MSSVPTPLANVLPKQTSPVLHRERLEEDRDERFQLREYAESLSKLREKLETVLDNTKSGYDSLKARALADARAGLLKGGELQKLTKFLLHSHETIEKLEKYMSRWTYIDLARESLFGKDEKEREEAKEKLGYKIFKDTTSSLAKFAHEVGLLSKDFTAKEFLVKILGKGAVLTLEGLELPLTIALEMMSPTQLADDDTLFRP